MHIKQSAVLPSLLLLFCLTGCCKVPDTQPPEPYAVQSYAQLHLHEPDADSGQTKVIAAWIPYFTIEAMLTSDDPVQTENNFRAYLSSLKRCGINTVFVHVCAFGESSYPSAYYPYLPAANGYDVMRLFSILCKELDLSLHAWLNPLRLQTIEYTESQSGDSLLRKWFQDEEKRRNVFAEWNGRYFLNPADDSTAAFLTDAIHELITTYHPDGIHIDDYFYPTAETAFDEAAFLASGEQDLAAWRRKNITALVRKMYAAVHNADPDTVFSISPQGNFSENQNVLFADVAAWIGDSPCCDWIIPQLYFGYKNEKSPFDELLRSWSELPRNENVKLMIGLAAYKSGQPDLYAGTGENEWIETENLLAEQAADALCQPAVNGVALYHTDAIQELSDSEFSALNQALSECITPIG